MRSYNAVVTGAETSSLSTRLAQRILRAGGWWPFDRFMAAALYEPGLGYYSRDSRQFGLMPDSGSDFVTSPELSPLFGAALARQVTQALVASGTDEVFEFGAGSGALAEQLLQALDPTVRYRIVDLSGALRQRQAARLLAFGERVQWLDALPSAINGVVVGNEVLDAMPVQLLHWDGEAWHERGVAVGGGGRGEAFVWQDRPTPLRPPVAGPFVPGTVTEIHAQAEAFVRTLAERLQRGAAFFIDYGFPEHEYYHPQRCGGTLMCHRGHRADANPLADVGEKDITAHVNFTGIALAGQEAGLEVIGYTSQARFLMNCGLLELLQGADLRTTANAQKLLTEHEMGELFKVIGFARGTSFEPIGFSAGDRCHTL
jgi:SAM-dependent MidA family methyltransferase